MKTITLKTFRAQSGFSLAELMVACAMVGVVLAGTFVALQSGESAFQYSSGKVEVQQNGRVALDRMLRDLRTGSSVTAATPTSISFVFTDETNTAVTVTYSLAGTNLQRNQTNPVPAAAQPETVVGGVNTFALVTTTPTTRSRRRWPTSGWLTSGSSPSRRPQAWLRTIWRTSRQSSKTGFA